MADSVSKEMTAEELRDFIENMPEGTAVSYTHLTLPTS